MRSVDSVRFTKVTCEKKGESDLFHINVYITKDVNDCSIAHSERRLNIQSSGTSISIETGLDWGLMEFWRDTECIIWSVHPINLPTTFFKYLVYINKN